MVKDSLKSLLDKYPYFLDKNVSSNFYRVVQVQNENFKKIYQDLVDVYEGFHLNKKLCVWKEQNVPYNYTIRFLATYPNIKNVKLYKNDEAIYIRGYATEDPESVFDYSYTYDTRNDTKGVDPSISYEEDEDAVIIPVEEQERMDKLLVWRINKDTEDSTIQYSVNVKATYTRLKKITIYKNNTQLHTESFSDTTNETVFEYSYNNTYTPPEPEYDENNELIEPLTNDDTFKVIIETYDSTEPVTKFLPTEEADYIPEDTFLIEVETYDEYIYRKGFPENDTSFDNEVSYWNDYVENHEYSDYENHPITYNPYDHDLTLDYMGYLNNIPRKEYIEIDTLDEYYRSEPPFNNRRSEDDYHYMKRMLEYNLKVLITPAPVLEIWKLYGLPIDEINMVNRERLLLKMFDITKHDHHKETKVHPCDPNKTYETLVVDGWVPEPWEHKDQFFLDENRLGEYFFAQANTVRPVKKKPVTFTFKFLNSLAEDISKDYLVDIYLNDELILENVTSKQWICEADQLDEYNPNVFIFVGKTTEKEIGRVEITVTVRGCSDADFYVRQSTGNDNNDGSRTKPFKTLKKALESATSVFDLIAVVGEVTSNNIEKVPVSCTLIGCKDGNITPKIINTNPSDRYANGKYTKLNTSRFFNVAQDQTLTIQDIEFRTTEKYTSVVEDMDFTNNNVVDETETALLYNVDYGIPIYDTLQDTFIKNLTLNDSTGLLTWDVISKSELSDTLSYDGIVTTLELTDDFYCTEHYTHEVTTESSSFDKSFLYYSDREDLLNATYYINDSLNDLLADGLLDYDEYGDEVIYDLKEHGIDEFQHQFITAIQGEFTPMQANLTVGSLKLYPTILNPVVGQIINLRSSEGATASFKINSVNGDNVTFKQTTGSSSATGYLVIQAIKNETTTINLDLERKVTGTGFVYVGSSTQIDIHW